jgi:hypothetical protein
VELRLNADPRFQGKPNVATLDPDLIKGESLAVTRHGEDGSIRRTSLVNGALPTFILTIMDAELR